LRLAALSLAGHPDPERFAADFSGSERTVAEYLLAEVLERQPQEVRRLLLRTSLLKRVSGPLADALTGGSDGERILLGLEAVNAFVVSVDPRRSWFRYHRLFADLLQMELRRIAPEECRLLHSIAADWFAEHGYPVEAIRHAQAAEDWSLATRLLVDNSLGLYLDGRLATVHELLAAFPAGVAVADPELNAVAAGDELNRGSLEAAERHLVVAASTLESVPPERRGRLEVTLGILRLSAARQRGDLPAVVEEAQRVIAPVGPADVAELEMTEERRAVALISLGTAELWTARLAEAERHLDQGTAIARRIHRPYLEFTGLAHAAVVTALTSSVARSQERSIEAIELAERHGWSEEPSAALAYMIRGGPLVWQGRLQEAEPWLDRAERVLQAELEPAAAVLLHIHRGGLELARGRHQEALERFRSAEQLAQRLITPHMWTRQVRSTALQTLVQMGRHENVERPLAEMNEDERDSNEIRTAEAMLRLAQNDPQAAASVLAAVIDHPDFIDVLPMFAAQVWLLNANAREALGDGEQAERSLELALELAEPDGLLWPFLLCANRGLLERHPRHRTAHRALLSEILNLLDGKQAAAPAGRPEPLREPLSQSETRVLRCLPTNLSQAQIANELYVSVHTIRTHVKHLYAKLEVHERAEAVERARVLGLLAPSLRKA
jgi:LuxR family maltose regulon positive regulatory protein